MKVCELIEELRRFSQSMEVRLVNEDGVVCEFGRCPLVLDEKCSEAEDGANSPRVGYLDIHTTGARM